MKRNPLTLPVSLSALLGITLFSAVLLRTFLPGLVLPRWDVPGVVLFCLPPLLTEHYFSPQARHRPVTLAFLGALNFGLMPWAAGMAAPWAALRLAAAGAVALPLGAAVFSAQRRTAPSLFAPLVWALGIYLTVQPLRSIWL